jgi:hypothetical protein
MKRYRRSAMIVVLSFVFFVPSVVPSYGDNPCVSGTPVGQKPGPYTFHVATGPERGQLTCYV